MSKQITLSIPGIKCGHCVATIEAALNDLDGVSRVNIDLHNKSAQIDANVPIERVIETIQSAGYQVDSVE